MKLKRLFTAILSAALTLSLCAMPAMADDGAAGTGTGPLKTPTAIDWNKTGKLTIHKYETDSVPTPTDPTDDGETSTVTNGKPLNGVTFTLYKVKDDAWLKEYYQGTYTGTPTKMPSWSDYVERDGTPKENVSLPTGTKVITANDGTAVAENLDLGLYLVVETDKPDAVKETTEPFLVSIPMTAVNMTDWLYDVTVNPKNVTKYGDVTLKKVGYTGSKPDGTVMSGYTFKLYKWKDPAWVQITNEPKNGQDNKGDPLTLTTNNSGEISVAGLTKGVYAFVETGVNKKQGYILDADTAYVFKLDADGAMQDVSDADVALMQTTVGGTEMTLNNKCVKAAVGSTTNKNLEVINYKPDLNKTVKDRKGNPSDKHHADYAIGDKVPFVLTITVPENIAKLSTFKVTDSVTPTQLAYNNDVTVKGIKKTETAENTLTATTDYTITYSNSSFTIDFKGTGVAINAYAGGTITITYSATLQEGAAVVDGTTLNTVNKNSAELKYSGKTTVTSEQDDSPYTIHEEAAVYTFKAGIHKTDGAGTALDGVKFDLYKKFDDATDKKVDADGVMYKGKKVLFLADDDATRLGLNAAGSTDKWYKVAELTTAPTTGKVVVNGLPKGTYKFVETQTKKDYNLLTKPVDANLNVEYKTVRDESTAYNTDGTKTHNVTSTTYKVGAKDYKYEDIEVINRKGFTLPVTGGFGTLLFSGIGLLLVLVGVSVLFSLKKKTNRA
ncbi:SpaH/EbpB family LPXTG-anchored major pilin [uncultured Gemmiger sp.]|uniref:SpaH/EbpB family LPXTG-anchored major pilin n=1 Tax=uncultured Gemmiger sp. TaxID=1623490 RepID=UPI0025DC4874|nr:SpaH/EbpB family LPXTG-anchored major pilin [uncultured Gemmiger sp.]